MRFLIGFYFALTPLILGAQIKAPKINEVAIQPMGGSGSVKPAINPIPKAKFAQNNYNGYSRQQAEWNEILSDLNEARNNESVKKRTTSYSPNKFTTESASYWKAKAVLNDMLSGKISLSLKDAFYSLENAYGNTYLSYAEYNSTLRKSAQFIKQWLNEHGHNTTDNRALHFGIQAFMGDTLTVSTLNKERLGVSKIKHLPFTYDYLDFRAEQDFRNYFVTKTLATGTGQCNSLPITYLLLAEQLGAKAYLSYAPLHSFIKFPDSEGVIHNYEPTSNYEISDQWYANQLKVSQQAYKSKIYLDTLNKKQIVAAAMLDLAYGYITKHGLGDGVFVSKCVQDAMPYFPNKVANVQGWLLQNTLLVAKLHGILQRDGVRDLKDIDKSPEGKGVYNHLVTIDKLLDELGYEDLPKEIYQQLMQEQNAKGKRQKETTNTKTKRDLFTTDK
jgi:hypothetical protein